MLPKEAAPSLLLVPGLGTGSMRKGSHWAVCSEKLSVEGACRQKKQGCLGKSLAALSWSLKLPVGQSSPLAPGLGAGFVQKGSHWGACSEKLAMWEEPTAGVHRAAWGRL